MNTIEPRRMALAYALGLTGVSIFGATLPATRIAIQFFDAGFVTFGRAVVATLLAALFLIVLRRQYPKGKTLAIFIAGVLTVYGFPGFSALAMLSVPASHGGIVLGILPLTTAMFAALFGGERPSLAFWACAFVGAALVVAFTLQEGDMHFAIGDLWLLLAGLSASCGYVIFGKLSRQMPGWEVICWALIVTAPLSLVGTIWTYIPAYLSPPTAELWAFIYVSIFSMFFGFFAWNSGLAMGGIARIGQVQLLQIFVTLAVAALVNGESIGMRTLLFALAVAVTVGLGHWTRVHHKPH